MVGYLGLIIVGTLLAAIPVRGASLQGLGDLPGGAFNSSAAGVSGNGLAVVGSGCNATWWQEAFLWTADGGMEGLGHVQASDLWSYATDTSEDGSVVVGYSGRGTGPFQPFRWTRETGMVGLGGQTPLWWNWAAVSADGSVVAVTLQNQAFRWTEAEGMTDIGDLSGGYVDSFAYDMSFDGSVIVGTSSSASGYEAFKWTAGAGMTGLGDLAGGSFESVGRCVSGDGLVIGGWSESGLGTEACVWRDGLIEGLGGPAAGRFLSEALGISDDGSIVVGRWAASETAATEAFIWDAQRGIRDLKAVLTGDYGLDLTGWRLAYASGISADGRTIVGVGTDPAGQIEGWVATIPEPGTILLVGLGVVLISKKEKVKRQK